MSSPRHWLVRARVVASLLAFVLFSAEVAAGLCVLECLGAAQPAAVRAVAGDSHHCSAANPESGPQVAVASGCNQHIDAGLATGSVATRVFHLVLPVRSASSQQAPLTLPSLTRLTAAAPHDSAPPGAPLPLRI